MVISLRNMRLILANTSHNENGSAQFVLVAGDPAVSVHAHPRNLEADSRQKFKQSYDLHIALLPRNCANS